MGIFQNLQNFRVRYGCVTELTEVGCCGTGAVVVCNESDNLYLVYGSKEKMMLCRPQRLALLLVPQWLASVPTAVREPAVVVATANASALAPRSAVGTAVVSVPIVVHEPAVAIATADVFRQHLATSLLLLWRAQAPRCTNLRSHTF